jgi:hypothetical protein
MNWLDRLKKIEMVQEGEPTKPTKLVNEPETKGFVGFVAPFLPPVQKPGCNQPALSDPDRWCWPHSDAMTSHEIDTFTARLARFTDKGGSLMDSEALADKLVIRDREQDDRRLCLECMHLAGFGSGSWRCGAWQAAGVAIRSHDAQSPDELVMQLQHCGGFKGHAAGLAGERPKG